MNRRLDFRQIAAGVAVGVAIGAGGYYLYVNRIQPVKVQPDSSHHALKYGSPISEIVKEYEGYVVGYDFRTKNPKWVLEHITADSMNGGAERANSTFYEEAGIEPWLQAKLSDYRGSGYDRGHMAPAANHKSSQKAMDETFSLLNISPQVGQGFNRDFWARFEKYVKDVCKKCNDVYIVTGPLWLPNQDSATGKWVMKHDMIGQPPSLVSVPTHYYKVVLADGCSVQTGGSSSSSQAVMKTKDLGVAAFVMPNAPIEAQTPLTAFVVPLAPLEAVAGTKFFPTVLNSSLHASRRAALDEAARGWRHQGLAALPPFKRQTLLEGAHAPLALPPPASLATTNATVSSGSSSQGSLSSAESPIAVVPAPKTKPGEGAVHLCELVACKMPPEKFWEKGGGSSSSSGSSTRSGSGAGSRSGYSQGYSRR